MNFWKKGRLAIARALRLELIHSQERYARVLREHVTPGIRWLEIGCGRQVVPGWAMPEQAQGSMAGLASLFVGIDVDGAIHEHPLLKERVIGLGGALPFCDGCFQLVTANMVAEHVPEPLPFLKDIHRVLEAGGRFLLHTPNYLHYLVFLASITPDAIKKPLIYRLEQRAGADVFPTHYRMNTAKRITALSAEAGFRVEHLQVLGSVGAFQELGPIGWLECIPLKLAATVAGGKFDSNLIAVLVKR